MYQLLLVGDRRVGGLVYSVITHAVKNMFSLTAGLTLLNKVTRVENNRDAEHCNRIMAEVVPKDQVKALARLSVTG
jgi:hypothetical protein